MRKAFTIIALLVLVLLVRYSYRHYLPLSTPVVAAKYGPAVQAVYATATVEPEIMLPLSPRSTAKLIKLLVDEGAVVKQGDLLAELESEDVRASISELEARENFAKSDYERNAKLFKQKEAPEQSLERARAEWTALRAARVKMEQQAEFLKIRAPSDGKIIRRDGELGQLIPAGEAVFWLSASDTLRLNAEVDEENIPDVKLGMKALVRADAFPGKHFKAEVSSITPKGDPTSRSYRVRLKFPEPVPLQVGMTAEVNIIIQEKAQALLVPTTSIYSDSVYTIESGRAQAINVKVGIRSLERSEILDGLTSGQLVIQKPQDYINSTRPLHATPAEEE